jgi:BirA family biotin operon repressor/biotin-[acetyl-CoA-carboxylase] ligase
MTRFDGMTAESIADAGGAPAVVVFDEVGSTMDEAHRLAERGAADGTAVIADVQTAGRGRHGRRWVSARGAGLSMTVIHRGVDIPGLDVLSLRIGLALAPVLEPYAADRVLLKWPNDLFVRGRKLAGMLVEARWREAAVEWVAVGIGVNVVAPADQPQATGLAAAVARGHLAATLLPAVRAACRAVGPLTNDEMMAFSARDAVRGSRLVEPAAGVARGITTDGSLLVEGADGTKEFRRGSVVFALEA